ncbi:DUF2442 domain-containing protein [Fulvimarina sp. MAC8]|uniref:DUF2442 domain-containing protein n=1 Tax=Fulvimarina sp. MAC8 TaxID=3162874 RepID=UPI0032ECF96F
MPSFLTAGGKSMDDFEFSEADIEAAERAAKVSDRFRPLPRSVRYDAASGRVVVDFMNGSVFTVPARSLQGLQNASDEALAEVELLGETGLRWVSLDADFRIEGPMAGIFGTARYMEERKSKTHDAAATDAA